MTDIVERVARQICVADGVDPDAEGYGLGVQMPEGERYPLWRARIKQARAAIEAMREPTDMIIHAGDAESMRFRGEALQIWRGMIDAALAEKS